MRKINKLAPTELWKYATKPLGWILNSEFLILYLFLVQLNSSHNVVELGSYAGKSSMVFGHLAFYHGFDFTCVDNFEYTNPFHGNTDIFAEFEKNMNQKSVPTEYTLLHLDFNDAFEEYDKKIDFLFIDGNHKYESIRNDYELWSQKLNDGAWVILHDYDNIYEPGVKRFVQESGLIHNRHFVVGTMFIMRYEKN